ncbi:Homeobox protein Mohawk [Bagarius yarrelli]|uniref:Homeobox protein Mohawk n=1 Tax=Bagarius yarrelli TaxID=175774 RepID=A0A556V8L7_BAGYA|nr:Homeobox protein Mohawk [Bagarius yarrelli]
MSKSGRTEAVRNRILIVLSETRPYKSLITLWRWRRNRQKNELRGSSSGQALAMIRCCLALSVVGHGSNALHCNSDPKENIRDECEGETRGIPGGRAQILQQTWDVRCYGEKASTEQTMKNDSNEIFDSCSTLSSCFDSVQLFDSVLYLKAVDHGSTKCDSGVMVKGKGRGKDETYWREINAAMALTNLAKPKDGALAGTTSCIIQKSSHIAEIKTVKVPIMHKY